MRTPAASVLVLVLALWGRPAMPDVVVTDHLPPGTTFVVAHRQPDWAEVPAVVDGDA